MSLTFDPNTGDPRHTPKRRDVFEFDKEVASIFENMAVRSIPMYAETHNVHASILKGYAKYRFPGQQYAVCDVGASTGAFIKTLSTAYGIPAHQQPGHFRAYAIDPSAAMTERVIATLPWVVGVTMEAQFLQDLGQKFHAVNLSYVLQFVPRPEHSAVVQAISEVMCDGGLLFVSQKVDVGSTFDTFFTEEYIQFRRDNGYSDEEIAGKTAALNKSMWVDTLDYTKELLIDHGFWQFQDTTRWLNFSSFVCVKHDG